MKVKSTVLLGLVLFICLLCAVSLLAHMNSKQEEWRPGDIYSTLGGSRGNYFSTVSYGAGASSVESMPVLTHSSSLFNHGAAFSYAHAYAPSHGYSQAPVIGASMPQGGLYLTSSAEVHTFGGGSNAALSMNGSSVSSAPVLPIASVNGLHTSSSLSTASQLAAGAGLQMPSGMMSGMSAGDLAMAAAYAGIGQTTAGGPMGIGGRHNAPPPAWYGWLLSNAGTFGTASDGSYGFTYEQLWAAYQAYINNYWDGGLGQPAPDFNDWLTWLQNQGEGGALYWIATPVGDVWVLLILAIAYAVFVWLRKRQLAQCENF